MTRPYVLNVFMVVALQGLTSDYTISHFFIFCYHSEQLTAPTRKSLFVSQNKQQMSTIIQNLVHPSF